MSDQTLNNINYCLLMFILVLFGIFVGFFIRDQMYNAATSQGPMSPRIIVVPGQSEKSELNEIIEFDSISF